MQPSSIACENSSPYFGRGRRAAHCGLSSSAVYEFTFRRTTTRNKARGGGSLGLDGGRARARHLGLLGGDELRARGASPSTCSTRRATRISVRRANAIRRFRPSVVSYEGKIYWLAGVAVKRRRSASSPSRRVASALRSGSRLHGGTCRRRSRRCHRRVTADPPCGCHNCMVIAWMSAAAGSLF